MRTKYNSHKFVKSFGVSLLIFTSLLQIVCQLVSIYSQHDALHTHTQHFFRKKIWLSLTVCHWWSMNFLYFRRYLHFQWGMCLSTFNFLSSVPFSYSHYIIYPSICGISLSFLHVQIILTFCVYCIISWLTQLSCLLSLRKCYVNGFHHNKNPT